MSWKRNFCPSLAGIPSPVPQQRAIQVATLLPSPAANRVAVAVPTSPPIAYSTLAAQPCKDHSHHHREQPHGLHNTYAPVHAPTSFASECLAASISSV